MRDEQASREVLIRMGGVLTAGLEDQIKPGVSEENVQALQEFAAIMLQLGKKGEAEKAIKRGKRVLAKQEDPTSYDLLALSNLNNLHVSLRADIKFVPLAHEGQTSVSPDRTPPADTSLEAMLQMSEADSATEAAIGETSPPESNIHELLDSLRADPGARYLRVVRLRDAFADSRRFDGDACAQLPPTEPPVSWVKDHIVSNPETPTGVREYTGWVDLATDRTYSDYHIKGLLNDGYGSLHKLCEFLETRCKYLLEQSDRPGEELNPAVTAAVKKLVELIASVQARAGMNDYRRQALAESKVELAKQTDRILSDEFNSAAIDHALLRNDISRETRDQQLPGRPLWAWSGNEVTRPAPDEIDEPYSRDVNNLVAQLFSPQGEEVMGVLGRISVRLSAARPDPATYVQAQPPQETRAFVVSGDPSPGRDRIYRPTPEERDRVFAHSVRGVEAAGSGSDDLFELPAGRVLVLPRGDEAYLRGCGLLITRDRRLKGWDWRGEPGRPLPVGGVMEVAGNQWKHVNGAANYSAVPLDGAQYYRGKRWFNRDGSGTLFDETVYEWEDRRDRIRSTFWGKLRGTMQNRQAADISSIVAPALHPAEWAFYFWTLTGPYMSSDDWRPPPGQWRWPDVGSPERDTPVQSALRYLVVSVNVVEIGV